MTTTQFLVNFNCPNAETMAPIDVLTLLTTEDTSIPSEYIGVIGPLGPGHHGAIETKEREIADLTAQLEYARKRVRDLVVTQDTILARVRQHIVDEEFDRTSKFVTEMVAFGMDDFQVTWTAELTLTVSGKTIHWGDVVGSCESEEAFDDDAIASEISSDLLTHLDGWYPPTPSECNDVEWEKPRFDVGVSVELDES